MTVIGFKDFSWLGKCSLPVPGHDVTGPRTIPGKVKVKSAMPQLGRRRGAHLPLAAIEPVGG